MSNDKKSDNTPSRLPVLATKDLVVFSKLRTALAVGRTESVKAVENALQRHNGMMIITMQKDQDKSKPGAEDLYPIGTLVRVLEMQEAPNGSVNIAVEGKSTVKIDALALENGGFSAAYQGLGVNYDKTDIDLNILREDAIEAIEAYAREYKQIQPQVFGYIMSLKDDIEAFTNALCAGVVDMEPAAKQKLLETGDLKGRLEVITSHIQDQNELLDATKSVRDRTQGNIEKNNKEYHLREQMKAIRQELGEEGESEFDALREKLNALNLPEKVREKAEKQLKRLESTNPASPEAGNIRTYLDYIIDIPWNKPSTINNDTKSAKERMDADHYGLEKVKKQIVKHLAVQRRLEEKGLSENASPKIMCLVGPPGVGKTSIAKSLAEATGREYIRMALGGVRDEAEIRGHRSTYIGAKPGKIIHKMIEAGVSNPLFVLDEIDKMGSDQRGDPASAMLEVLDPEQNKAFEDHYLDAPYDLSDVMFVATANTWSNIPGPLQDRMETIFLGSYTPEEKLEIADRHLVPKQMKAHGLEEGELSIDRDALMEIINLYTMESGVRNLQREIGNLCAEAVMRMEVGEAPEKLHITKDMLEDYLGPQKVTEREKPAQNAVGVVSGLAYTQVGGKPLVIEAVTFPDKNFSIKVTGNVEKVMQESVQYAVTYLRKHAEEFGLGEDAFKEKALHVHCPEGAVKKDGPSAGAAMLTAIFSEVSGKEVRHDVAMTGEINLRGNVTAIGGLTEKLAGAARAGYKKVLIPQSNAKDLFEVPQQILDKLEIVPVSHVDEVLEHTIIGFRAPTPKAA